MLVYSPSQRLSFSYPYYRLKVVSSQNEVLRAFDPQIFLPPVINGQISLSSVLLPLTGILFGVRLRYFPFVRQQLVPFDIAIHPAD